MIAIFISVKIRNYNYMICMGLRLFNSLLINIGK